MGCEIVVRNLYKRYGGVEALRGISLTVPQGSLVAILGPNGAGKTTLLRAMAGSLRLTRGDVLVCGISVRRDPLGVRSLVGFVAEHPMLFPELSVLDNVIFAARLHGVPRRDALERARVVLDELGLWELRDRRYAALSKGLKRRADIAAALIHDPEVLVLDEPSSGLDPLSAAALRREVRRLNKAGKTIILATHNIAEAMELAGLVYVLVNGRLGAHGEPEKLRRVLGGRETVFIAELSRGAEEAARLLIGMGIAAAPLSDTELRVAGEASAVIPALVDAARRIGAEIRKLMVKELTWEEVFARLLERSAQGSGGGGCACCPAPQPGRAG